MNAPVCGMQLSESRHTHCHMGVVDRFIVRDQPLPDAEYYCYHCSLPGLFTRDFASIPAAPVFSPPRDRIGKFAPPLAKADQWLKVGIVWSGRRHLQAQPGNSPVAAALLPRSCLARGPTLQSAERPARTRILSQSPNDRFWRKADIRPNADVRFVPTTEVGSARCEAARFEMRPLLQEPKRSHGRASPEICSARCSASSPTP
jgi:hypothetical protein